MDISIATLPAHVLAIGGLIVAFAGVFLALFVVPAVRTHLTLSRVLKSLHDGALQGPVDLAAAFEGQGILQHLWSEFRETLHEERVLNPQTGMQQVARLRASQPAAEIVNVVVASMIEPQAALLILVFSFVWSFFLASA